MILLFVFYVSQRSSLLVVHCMVAGRANTATCLLTVSCLGPAHMVFRTEHLHPRTVAATTPRPRYQCTTQWKPGGMTGPWSLQGSYRRAGTGSRPRVTMRPTSRRDGASPRTASRPRPARPDSLTLGSCIRLPSLPPCARARTEPVYQPGPYCSVHSQIALPNKASITGGVRCGRWGGLRCPDVPRCGRPHSAGAHGRSRCLV